MSANLINLRTIQFSDKFALLSQQFGSRLQGLVAQGQYQGKQASPVNQVAPTAAVAVTERFTPIDRQDAAFDRRWVFPLPFEHAQLVDKFDELQMLGDPKPSLVMNAANAMGRAKDDVILGAFFATAKTGELAAGSVAFGTTLTTAGGQNVSVSQGASAATNLTVAKLREVVKTFLTNNVDLDREQITGALNAKAHDSLLGEIQVTSMDYQTKPVLEEGRIRRFMGINFVLTEEVTGNCAGTDDLAGSSTGIPFWVNSGMHLGVWIDQTTNITQRTDLKLQPWQIYMDMMIGATRIEEKKVVRVWCR
ncbi:phage capsid protein [Dongia sp. agr-C8]